MTVYARRDGQQEPGSSTRSTSGADYRHDEHGSVEFAPNASVHRPDDHPQHLDPAQQKARAHAMAAYVDPVEPHHAPTPALPPEIAKSFAALEGQRHAMDKTIASPHAAPKPDAKHAPEAAPAVDAKTTAAIQASFATLEQHRIDMDVAKTFTDVNGAMLAGQIVAKKGDVGDKNDRYQILNLLERTTDPSIRHAMMQQYEKQTGESLQTFLANADWKGSRDAAEAQALISPDRDRAARDLGAMAPDARAKLAVDAEKWAEEIVSNTTGSGTDTAEHAHAVSNLMAKRSPAEIEAIRAAISSTMRTRGTYELMDRAFSKGNEDEAVAGLGGNKIHTVSVALANADGDPARIKELLHGLSPQEIEKLKRENPTFDPKKNPQWAGEQAKGIEQKEITELLSGNRAAADGDRLQALLQPSLDGVVDMYDPGKRGKQLLDERSPEHVLKELESMPPDQLAAAVAAYDGTHKQKLAAMVKDRFANSATSKDPSVALRLQAVLVGDRASAKAFELQQGLASHDQAKIENALTDSTLTANTEEGGQHRAQRESMNAGFQALDYAQQLTAATKRGDATALAAVKPRTMTAALDAHYDRELHATEGEARRKVHDNQIAAGELAASGELAVETKIHRAREAGDTKGATAALKQLKTNKELRAAAESSGKKYGTGLYEQVDLDDYEEQAGTLHSWFGGDGKDKTTLAQREEIARMSQMSAAQKEAYDIEKYGVASERDPALQRKLAIRNYQLAHGGILDSVELMTSADGGAVGASEAAMWQTTAVADSVDTAGHLREGVTKEVFQQRSDNASTAQNQMAAEKLKLAEDGMETIASAIKVGSMAFGNAGYMVGSTSADLLKMVGKKAIAGNEYDHHADLKHAGISAVVDTLPVFGELAMGAKAAKAVASAEELVRAESGVTHAAEVAEATQGAKAVGQAATRSGTVVEGAERAHDVGHTLMMGSQMGGAVAHGVADGKSPLEIAEEVAKTGLLFSVPAKVSGQIENLFGRGSAIGRLLGAGTEVATNAAVGGGSLGENAAQVLTGRVGHHVTTPGGPRHLAPNENQTHSEPNPNSHDGDHITRGSERPTPITDPATQLHTEISGSRTPAPSDLAIADALKRLKKTAAATTLEAPAPDHRDVPTQPTPIGDAPSQEPAMEAARRRGVEDSNAQRERDAARADEKRLRDQERERDRKTAQENKAWEERASQKEAAKTRSEEREWTKKEERDDADREQLKRMEERERKRDVADEAADAERARRMEYKSGKSWDDPTMSSNEFIGDYRAKYPDSELTDAELREHHDDGRRLDPTTGRLRDPKIAEAPDILARYKGPSQELPFERLSSESQERAKELLNARDAARTERDSLKNGGGTEKQVNEAQKKVNDASRDLGEIAGEAHIFDTYPGPPAPKKLYPEPGAPSRPGDFDQVWQVVTKEGAIETIIVEAKGGTSPLGSRKVEDPRGLRAQQGTQEYMNDIIVKMQNNPELAQLGDILASQRDLGLLKYVQARFGIGLNENGASIPTDLSVREFDVAQGGIRAP